MRRSGRSPVGAKYLTAMVVSMAIVTMAGPGIANAQSFVNWETPHVSPLAITPDGNKLLAVNTPDNRLEVFDSSQRFLTSLGSIPVGLDPVSVRARNNDEAWVVNHISDSVSIVDLNTMNVVRTVPTLDEPADIVFAGVPEKAFVSCSQANTVLVFDPANLDAAPQEVPILGEDPRMMAVSEDGSQVFVAVFESGNQTTIVGVHQGRSVVIDPEGPYGGQYPVPNDGAGLKPPMSPSLPDAPVMGLIVKRVGDQWLDDNNGDWTRFVSGEQAFTTARVQGWDVIDNDVAVIDTNTLAVSYIRGLMNINMALGVRGDQVTVVGTEALNHVRFEPNLQGRFIRVNLAAVSPARPGNVRIQDLNPHLDYSDAQIAQQSDPATFSQALRDLSIGDPRAILWESGGRQGYVSGMGSNNVLVIRSSGARFGAPIEVGEGPTGLAKHPTRNRLYVLNKFESTISVVNTSNRTELGRVPIYDPSPEAVKVGRKHNYDTHASSALGHIACASCHVDSRLDRIAWDLGNPAGEMIPFEQNCGFGLEVIHDDPAVGDCHPYHPMKGPMLTQTLQDIIGHEPHHWRGDKKGLEEFNVAFTGLQGREALLTDEAMQEFEDFLATIHFPPNPFRNFDNTLPTSLELPGHYADGRFEPFGGLPAGAPMPAGDAVAGLAQYRFDFAHGGGPGPGSACRLCHTLPTGRGANYSFDGDPQTFPEEGSGVYVPIPPGPNGETHDMTTGLKFGGQREIEHTFTVPQLRNLYDRTGFSLQQAPSLNGFGFFHEGANTLATFVARFPGVQSDQQTANIVAFLLALSGSELPEGESLSEPPGPPSQDAHAAVGKQVTFHGGNNDDATDTGMLSDMLALANAGKIGIVAKGVVDGQQRGYSYVGVGSFQSDRAAEAKTTDELRTGAAAGTEMTFTVVPVGSETRMGIDRDEDGAFDRDELDNGSDPADPTSTP